MPFINHTPPLEKKECRCPEHNPPTYIVLPNGNHDWQCPVCGEITQINVSKPTF